MGYAAREDRIYPFDNPIERDFSDGAYNPTLFYEAVHAHGVEEIYRLWLCNALVRSCDADSRTLKLRDGTIERIS